MTVDNSKQSPGIILLGSVILFFVSTFHFCWGQGIVHSTPNEILKKAIESYNNGDIYTTIRSLEEVTAFFQGDDLFEANKYLAFSYARIVNNKEAENHFRVVLKLRPQWKLDPLESTPEIEDIFLSTKSEMAKEAGMCSCFIPGIGQMMKGENKKGIALLVASATAFVWGVTSWIITDQQHRNYLNIEAGDTVRLNRAYNRYNGWHHVSYISTAVFLGVYAFSVFDAYHMRTDSHSARALENIRLEYAGMEYGWRVGYNLRF